MGYAAFLGPSTDYLRTISSPWTVQSPPSAAETVGRVATTRKFVYVRPARQSWHIDTIVCVFFLSPSCRLPVSPLPFFTLRAAGDYRHNSQQTLILTRKDAMTNVVVAPSSRAVHTARLCYFLGPVPPSRWQRRSRSHRNVLTQQHTATGIPRRASTFALPDPGTECRAHHAPSCTLHQMRTKRVRWLARACHQGVHPDTDQDTRTRAAPVRPACAITRPAAASFSKTDTHRPLSHTIHIIDAYGPHDLCSQNHRTASVVADSPPPTHTHTQITSRRHPPVTTLACIRRLAEERLHVGRPPALTTAPSRSRAHSTWHKFVPREMCAAEEERELDKCGTTWVPMRPHARTLIRHTSARKTKLPLQANLAVRSQLVFGTLKGGLSATAAWRLDTQTHAERPFYTPRRQRRCQSPTTPSRTTHAYPTHAYPNADPPPHTYTRSRIRASYSVSGWERVPRSQCTQTQRDTGTWSHVPALRIGKSYRGTRLQTSVSTLVLLLLAHVNVRVAAHTPVRNNQPGSTQVPATHACGQSRSRHTPAHDVDPAGHVAIVSARHVRTHIPACQVGAVLGEFAE
ncbi:hypothetical protein C8R43DRAFT_1146430 [Mycena crocata]|nr:hypothetical protein C8R43DRAFT_1146430 [Mycena crocata]